MGARLIGSLVERKKLNISNTTPFLCSARPSARTLTAINAGDQLGKLGLDGSDAPAACGGSGATRSATVRAGVSQLALVRACGLPAPDKHRIQGGSPPLFDAGQGARR